MQNTSQKRLSILTNHILSKSVNNLRHFIQPNISSEKLEKEEKSTSNIIIEEKVLDALKKGKPIVALESTIISHGMPYPQNVQTAKLVEEQVIKYGSIPATIAILNGIIHVGLTNDQLELLGKLGTKCRKVSRRDIALCIAQKLNGSTTVAATMIIAHKVGIKVFVTGGIGGVHREFNETLDVSADLREMGRLPIAVVCAGIKSILDIPRTLEYLETEGVSVVGLDCDEFPAFFTRSSGCKVPIRLNSTEDCAKLIQSNHDLNLKSGMLIAVPIPKEQEAKTTNINKAIDQALDESRKKNINGKDITPFLLERINQLTEGESLKANIALILNNAKIGAMISNQLSKGNEKNEIKVPIVIGGSAIDITSSSKKIIRKTSNPGKIKLTFGGVARNVIEVLIKLNTNPFMITAIGKNDSFGAILKDHLISLGLDTRGILYSKKNSTGLYNCIINNENDLEYGIADMDIFNEITPKIIDGFENKIIPSSIVFMDCNLSIETMKKIGEICEIYKTPLFVDPTSVPKSLKFVQGNLLKFITFLKPNEDELFAISNEILQKKTNSIEEGIKVILDKGVKNIILTRGEKGVVFANKNGIKKFEALKTKVVNTTGAGDNFCGGFIFGITRNHSIEESIMLGQRASRLAISTEHSVHPNLSDKVLLEDN